MAGKVESEDYALLRKECPSFAKLLDILNGSLLQDGRSRVSDSRVKQVNYLEPKAHHTINTFPRFRRSPR